MRSNNGHRRERRDWNCHVDQNNTNDAELDPGDVNDRLETMLHCIHKWNCSGRIRRSIREDWVLHDSTTTKDHKNNFGHIFRAVEIQTYGHRGIDRRSDHRAMSYIKMAAPAEFIQTTQKLMHNIFGWQPSDQAARRLARRRAACPPAAARRCSSR